MLTPYKVPTIKGSWPIKIYTPANLPPGPRPLLVCAVGPSGDSTFYPVADKHGFVYCMFLTMTSAGTYFAGDQQALPEIVKFMKSKFSIDPNKIYLHGCSKGGNLTKLALTDPKVMPTFKGFAPSSIAWNSPGQNQKIAPALLPGDYTLYYMYGSNDKFGLYTSAVKGGPCGKSGTAVTEPGCQGSVWKWAPVAGMDQVRKDLGLAAFQIANVKSRVSRGVTPKGNGRALGYLRVAGAGHCFTSMNKYAGPGFCQEDVYTFLAAH